MAQQGEMLTLRYDDLMSASYKMAGENGLQEMSSYCTPALPQVHMHRLSGTHRFLIKYQNSIFVSIESLGYFLKRKKEGGRKEEEKKEEGRREDEGRKEGGRKGRKRKK